jgi:hypothetical protein
MKFIIVFIALLLVFSNYANCYYRVYSDDVGNYYYAANSAGGVNYNDDYHVYQASYAGTPDDNSVQIQFEYSPPRQVNSADVLLHPSPTQLSVPAKLMELSTNSTTSSLNGTIMTNVTGNTNIARVNHSLVNLTHNPNLHMANTNVSNHKFNDTSLMQQSSLTNITNRKNTTNHRDVPPHNHPNKADKGSAESIHAGLLMLSFPALALLLLA